MKAKQPFERVVSEHGGTVEGFSWRISCIHRM